LRRIPIRYRRSSTRSKITCTTRTLASSVVCGQPEYRAYGASASAARTRAAVSSTEPEVDARCARPAPGAPSINTRRATADHASRPDEGPQDGHRDRRDPATAGHIPGSIRAVSITVVATRDDTGAPTTREVYAAGTRYTIDNSNLQVFSGQSRLLALYGSGNWTSVYVGESMRVVRGMPEGERGETHPASAADVTTAPDTQLPTGFETDLDTDLETHPGIDLDTDFRTDFGTDLGTDFGPDSDVDADLGSRPAGTQRTVAATAPPRRADSDALGGPAPRSPQPSERTSSVPAHLRPVAFRPWSPAPPPKAPSEDDAAPGSGLRRVAFGPWAPKAPRTASGQASGKRDEAAKSESRSRMRPVAFKTWTYRAARTNPDARADDAELDDDADS
jgi:hypothetical protein